MLVLSRGRNDKVVFPTLGITVEILRVAGNKVRLGIDAPSEVPVYRHEVAERASDINYPNNGQPQQTLRLTHPIRNRLHTAALGLHLLHRKLEDGHVDDAESTIFKIFNELKAIEDELTDEERPVLHKTVDGRRRALVVEDNENERELLASYLRMSGFDVDTAVDGLQAMVKLARRPSPDVVLLDMKMPRFDGFKTISAIRHNPEYKGLKVFALSGTDQSESNISIGPNGVDRWLCKPLNPQLLVEAIQDELKTEFLSA